MHGAWHGCQLVGEALPGTSHGAAAVREWRRNCPTPEAKYRYLRLCGAPALVTLFKVEISCELLKVRVNARSVATSSGCTYSCSSTLLAMRLQAEGSTVQSCNCLSALMLSSSDTSTASHTCSHHFRQAAMLHKQLQYLQTTCRYLTPQFLFHSIPHRSCWLCWRGVGCCLQAQPKRATKARHCARPTLWCRCDGLPRCTLCSCSLLDLESLLRGPGVGDQSFLSCCSSLFFALPAFLPFSFPFFPAGVDTLSSSGLKSGDYRGNSFFL